MNLENLMEQANSLNNAAAQTLMEDENFKQVAIKQLAKELSMKQLQEMETKLQTIQDTADLSRADGSARKWRSIYMYECGEHTKVLFAILNGLRYAPIELKEQMEAVAKLNDNLISDTLSAIGNFAYYTPTAGYVAGSTPDAERAVQLVNLTSLKTGINIDTSELTQDKLELAHLKADARARKLEADHEKALKLAQLPGGLNFTMD